MNSHDLRLTVEVLTFGLDLLAEKGLEDDDRPRLYLAELTRVAAGETTWEAVMKDPLYLDDTSRAGPLGWLVVAELTLAGALSDSSVEAVVAVPLYVRWALEQADVDDAQERIEALYERAPPQEPGPILFEDPVTPNELP